MENIKNFILKNLYKSTFISLFFLSGCAQMIPGLTEIIDDAVTDNAVTVSVERSAIENKNDLNIQVSILNKNPNSFIRN